MSADRLMTHLTEPHSPPIHRRVLQEARTVCDEARKDRRAVTGAVAALGVGLMLGLFLKPTVADSDPWRSTVSGVASVEPGLVRTEGVDILVTARASPEGQAWGRRTLLEAPVFRTPGPAPLPVQRVAYRPVPDEATPEFAEPEPLFLEEPPPEVCEDDCLEVMDDEPFPEPDPL